jgi:cell wall-associated NlpC family hydrolase
MWIDRYMRVPFTEDGRTFEGCNCWGLFRLIYRHELGLDIPSYATTPATDIRGVARNIARDKSDWPLAAEPADYDMVLMRGVDRAAGRAVDCHVGLYWQGFVLHTERATGPVLVQAGDARIRGRIVEYRRHHSLV